MESTINPILEFSVCHPYVLLALVIVLVIVLTGICVWPCIWGKGRNKKKEDDCEDTELDSLIASINEKQKKKKPAPTGAAK